ncbi:hypothetical protein [Archaeoglobus sp.]
MRRLKEVLKLKGKRIERMMVIALAGLVGVLGVASRNTASVFIFLLLARPLPKEAV